MEIHQRTAGPVTVLAPVGRLVLSEAQPDTALRDTVIQMMLQGRRHFLLDLAHISQIDTSGLTMLVGAHLAVVKRGGHIKLLNPTRRLREIFSVTKLNTFFEVFDTESDAVNSFPSEQEQDSTSGG
jgi:anti-sigma B factor antagonist